MMIIGCDFHTRYQQIGGRVSWILDIEGGWASL
jgi:hypothetical protein